MATDQNPAKTQLNSEFQAKVAWSMAHPTVVVPSKQLSPNRAYTVAPTGHTPNVQNGFTDVKFQQVDDKGTSRPNPLLEKLKDMWEDSESILRLSVTVLVLIIFSLVSAGIFYAIERDACHYDFARSLWFVSTIFTTIGYGNIFPCTTGGKIVTVIIAIIGIPLNIIVLASIGKLFSRILYWFYIGMVVTCNKIKNVLKRDQSKKDVETVLEEGNMFFDPPIPLALVVTILWFLLIALFFYLTEQDHMGYGDAFYFVMMSVTTIGLGDITPANFNLVILQFFFIFIGIAFFSMLINILQDNLDELALKVEALIIKESKKAQQEGKSLGGGDKKAARKHIANIIKQQRGGALLRVVMSKSMEDRLVEEYIEKATQQTKATQTDDVFRHIAVQAVPLLVDTATEPDVENVKKEEPKPDGKHGFRNLAKPSPVLSGWNTSTKV